MKPTFTSNRYPNLKHINWSFLENCQENGFEGTESADNKRIFFTGEKSFYMKLPVSQPNNRVWASGHKTNVDPSWLIFEQKWVSIV